MKKVIKGLTLILLTILTTVCFSCYRPSKSTNIDSIAPINPDSEYKQPTFSRTESEVLSTRSYQNAINDFSFSLFKTLDSDENVCISPLSVYLAFACLSNASDGETLKEISSAMGLTPEEINEYCSYLIRLYEDDDTNAEVVKIANSVWFKNTFAPKESFINDARIYYDADIFKVPFDGSTVKQTNNWVSEKTNGMIDKIVDSYSEQTIMQIINALLFEDKWEQSLQTDRKVFNNSDGTRLILSGGIKKLPNYFESEKAEAFSLYFKNSRFSFLGIRPKENINDYLSIFDANEYFSLTNNKKDDYDYVRCFVPYFELDYETSLIDSLKSMGIVDAFDYSRSNFARGWNDSDGIFVSKVKHKTHFELSQEGVKAAAITMIGMEATSVGPGYVPKVKYIDLDKPFVYMIIDNVYNVPIFMGTIRNLA